MSGVAERSGSLLRRPKDGRPNLVRSREAPLPPAPGGGGKFWLTGGSGEGRWMLDDDDNLEDGGVEAETAPWSKTLLVGRDC